MNVRTLYTGLASAMALAWLTAASAQETRGAFERALTVDTPLELDVSTGSGSIEIRRGAAGRAVVAGRIEVRPTRGRDAAAAAELVQELETDPPVELSGNVLRVGHIDEPDARRNVSISYVIDVPADTRVKSRTGSGTQSIDGVAGPIDVGSGSGDLRLANVGGPVEAHAGSGSIEAEQVAGAFRAQTGSGAVRLTQSAPGDVDVRTGSGGSRLEGVEGALQIRAGSGSIEVDGIPTGDWSLQTGSGSIRLRLPAEAGFEVSAQSGSGGVRTEHPVAGTVQRGRISGTVRDGGPTLALRTGSGSITIE